MLIGGGKLIEWKLRRGEQLLQQSRHDVEEISRYAETLNPLNLFWRGSRFELGRLFLTNQRLILLPYCQVEVAKAHLLQDVSYQLLDKAGLGIPKPKINFAAEPLIIELDQIHTLNPFQRQFGVHPTLYIFTWESTCRFKFVPGESPKQWARAIADLARAIDSHFGEPQDIEWAIERGRLVVLQARPITVLPRRRSIRSRSTSRCRKDSGSATPPTPPGPGITSTLCSFR